MEDIVPQEQVVATPKSAIETLGDANAHEPPPSLFLRDRNWVRQIHLNCVGGLFVEME